MNRERLTLGIGDDPAVFQLLDMVRSVHPIEWFVGTPIGMNRNAAIGFDHEQAHRRREIRRQASLIIHTASCYHQSHDGQEYPTCCQGKDRPTYRKMLDLSAKWLSTIHTALYRTTGGKIGRRLVKNDMLLLTTTGRRSGQPHTVPLLYLKDGDRLVVIASWGGRDYPPHWYLNLVADQKVTCQVEGESFEAIATEASVATSMTALPCRRVCAAAAGTRKSNTAFKLSSDVRRSRSS